MSYALATYALVVVAVLGYAAGLLRTRRRLAEALRARSGAPSGQIAVDSLGTRGV
jgi:hypothetical protein